MGSNGLTLPRINPIDKNSLVSCNTVQLAVVSYEKKNLIERLQLLYEYRQITVAQSGIWHIVEIIPPPPPVSHLTG